MDIDFKEFHCKKWNDIQESFNELVNDLNSRVIPAQNNSQKEWEIIRFEIWEDSGRIIAFPAKQEFTNRIDVTGNFLYCDEVVEDINKIIYSNNNDNYCTIETNKIINKLARIIMTNIPASCGFKYFVYNQDGDKISIV